MNKFLKLINSIEFKELQALVSTMYYNQIQTIAYNNGMQDEYDYYITTQSFPENVKRLGITDVYDSYKYIQSSLETQSTSVKNIEYIDDLILFELMYSFVSTFNFDE